MSVLVSREQVIACLRRANWEYSTKGKRNEIWKKKGSVLRLSLPTRKIFPEPLIRIVLAQAGLTKEQVEAFLRESIKHRDREG